MIYTRPYITKKFIAYAGDSRTIDVTLAVRVIDAFTKDPPLVPLNVRLKELSRIRPLRGESGFYCFAGTETVTIDGTTIIRNPIPNGNYTLLVEPDPTSGNQFNLQPRQVGQPWTTTFERPIVLPLPNPLQPLEVVTLSPTAAYPFPGNTTLVRGTVKKFGVAVGAAVVSTTYDQVDPADTTQTIPVDIETITDPAGEYVLFFKSLPAKTQNLTIVATKNGDQNQITPVIIEGSTLKNQHITFP
ncbi:MAG TPA: hypothetical protein VGQ41_21440 [Pyrinomonadaceae bacterium]|jgi:hypothetical protein|nr:hypothetical protein [Pyrinomonadaceae bacterium]